MKKKLVRQITDNALIAAIYYVITILLGGFAFNDLQFRISEIFLFLIFFRKDFIFGITIGCLLANFHSPLWPWDPIFGTLATFLSGLLIMSAKKMWLVVIYPTVINGLVVGIMLHLVMDTPLLATIGLVALGELLVLLLGHALFVILRKQKGFIELLTLESGTQYEE